MANLLAPSAAAVALALSTSLHGSTLHVDGQASPGGNGTSWETAFRFLQDALAAAAGDSQVEEIRVAGGTYLPDESEASPQGTGVRSSTFWLVPGVALRGGFAGTNAPDPDLRDLDLFPTILSGDLPGNDLPNWVNHADNAFHVVSASGVDAGSVLDGFVVRGGYASFGSDGAGAGIHLVGASPTVRRCVIAECLASSGGGLSSDGGSPTLSQCSFVGNYAWGGRGGALYLGTPSAPAVTECTFSGNQAFGAGGPGDGGAAFLEFDCPATFDRCAFVSNSATTSSAIYPTGGAVTSLADELRFDGCRFLHNTCPNGAGGAVWSGGDDVVFASCEFSANSSTVGGAAAIFLSTGVVFSNCTMFGNSAGDGGALSLTYSTTAEIANCILWASAANADSPYKAAIHKDDSSDATVEWTCIQSMWVPEPGEDPLDPENFPGCTDANPLFVDANGADNLLGTLDDDLRLGPDSPLIDAGFNGAVPSWSDQDAGGLPRFMDDPETPDAGVGTPPIVDVGAREFGQPLPDPDLNDDGVVDGADLGLLLGEWGVGASSADLDGDGAVDGADLGMLLAAWS